MTAVGKPGGGASAPAPLRTGRRLQPELRAAIIAAAETAVSLRQIARDCGCSDQTAKYVLDQEDPEITRRISERGIALRDAENHARFAASQRARAEADAAARARARAVEAGRPACRRASPALWALRNRPEAFTPWPVRGNPRTEAEARMAIGLAGQAMSPMASGEGDSLIGAAIALAEVSA